MRPWTSYLVKIKVCLRLWAKAECSLSLFYPCVCDSKLSNITDIGLSINSTQEININSLSYLIFVGFLVLFLFFFPKCCSPKVMCMCPCIYFLIMYVVRTSTCCTHTNKIRGWNIQFGPLLCKNNNTNTISDSKYNKRLIYK